MTIVLVLLGSTLGGMAFGLAVVYLTLTRFGDHTEGIGHPF